MGGAAGLIRARQMSASCFACRGALAPICLRFARSRSIRERRWQASRSGGASVQRRGWAEDVAGAGPSARAPCRGPGGQPQGRCRRPLPPFGVGSVRAEMLSTDGFGPSQATETAPDIGPHTPGRAHRATPVRQVVWGPWRSAIPARAAHHPARPVRSGRQKRCDGGPREARQRAASMRPFSFR